MSACEKDAPTAYKYELRELDTSGVCDPATRHVAASPSAQRNLPLPLPLPLAMAATVLRAPFIPHNPNRTRWSGSLAHLRRPLLGAVGDPGGASRGLRWSAVPPLDRSPCRRRGLVGYVGRAADGGEPNHSDVEVESARSKLGEDNNESEKAWNQVLESFKEQALKMRSVSQLAYRMYSAKAIKILEETSKSMMIQTDKASRDVAEMAKEIGEEGLEYIVAATENSPDSVKEIVEVFSSPSDDLKDISKVHDFHVGIAYGALLAIGGFTSFMVTGSTAAIRFGIILGSVLLTLSISSLRAWKSGKTSALLLQGQTAIATIIFIREWRLLFQRPSLPSAVMSISSGAVVAFYVYRIIVSRQGKGHGSDY